MKKMFGSITGFTIGFLCSTACAGDALTLDQAWMSAYQNNPSLEAQRAKLRATDEGVAQALSNWRPKIEATGNIGKTYQYAPNQAAFGTANFSDTTRGYGAQITQPIFRGFRTISETEAAKKEVMAGRAQLEDAEQQLMLDTATAFLDAYRDEAVLQIEHDSEDVLQQKLKETEARAKEGDLTQTDIRQAESRLARSQVDRLQAEASLIKDRSALSRLVGKDFAQLQQPQLNEDQPDLDATLQHAVLANPNIISAQYPGYSFLRPKIDRSTW